MVDTFADFLAEIARRDELPEAQRRELDRVLQAAFQEYRRQEIAATIRRAERRAR